MKPSNLFLLLSVLAMPAPSVSAADETAPASYAERLEAYKQQRAQATGPGISQDDRQIMSRSGRDLARLMPSPGLSVGDKAPDFTLSNAFGKPVRLYDRLADGPVILSFYRGAWCPYCNLQLRALRDSLAHFQAYGAHLVAVTPQMPDKSLEQVREDGYPFEILSDLDSEVMRAYKLYFEVPKDLHELYLRNFTLDLAEYNGPGRYALPVPGTFVIDAGGTIRAAFADTDYTRRMEPGDIVKALRTL